MRTDAIPPLGSDEMPEETRLLRALVRAARRSGIGPEDPLWPVLVALGQVVRHVSFRSREIESSLAQSLDKVGTLLTSSQRTADAEVERIRMQIAETETLTVARVAEAVGIAAERTLRRQGVVRDFRLAIAAFAILVLLLVGLCGGAFWLGQRRAEEAYRATEAHMQVPLKAAGAAAAKEWLRLMQWNDVAWSLSRCTGHTRRIGMREACDVPLWIGPPIPTNSNP